MGRMSGIKWEKTHINRPVHNIVSSDFPKYNPQPWKLMEGEPRIEWLLSFEYYRMWLEERDQWQKRMYPENDTVNVDVVKRYVLSFKNNNPQPKPEKKKQFRMKKFENVPSKTISKRPSDKTNMAPSNKKEKQEKEKTLKEE